MACSSGCKTQDHKTYAECMKAKSLKVAAVNSTVNGYTTGGSQ